MILKMNDSEWNIFKMKILVIIFVIIIIILSVYCSKWCNKIKENFNKASEELENINQKIKNLSKTFEWKFTHLKQKDTFQNILL